MGRNNNSVIAPRPPEGGQPPLEMTHDLAGRIRLARLGGILALAVWAGFTAIVLLGPGGPISDGRWLFGLAGGLALGVTTLLLAGFHGRPQGADLTRSIAVAQGFDLAPATESYRDRFGLNEAEALRHEREFRRWAALAGVLPTPKSKYPERRGAVPDYRDHLATEHLELFGQLCSVLPAGHPAMELVRHDDAAKSGDYAALSLGYEFAYGEAPDRDIWPECTYPDLVSWRQALARAFPEDHATAAVRALTGAYSNTSG